MTDYLPRALATSIRELQGAKRQPIKFSANTSATATASQIVRVRLPQGLLDLSTLTMSADVSILNQTPNATNGAVGFPTALYKYFQSVRFYAGGQLVSGGSCNHYNVLKNVLLKCQTSPHMYATKILNGFDEDIKLKQANSATTAVAGRTLIEDNWLGLPNCGGRYYNADVFGDLEMEIVLAPSSVVKGAKQGTGSKANLSFQLDNISFVCDRVTPPPVYLMMIKNKVQDGGIRMAFQNFVSQRAVLSGANRFQISTGCLDALVFTPAGVPVLAGAGDLVDAYESGEFIYNAEPTGNFADCKFQILLGENSIPNNVESALLAYDYTSNCFNRDMMNSHNQLALSGTRQHTTANIDNYQNVNHIIAVDCSFEGESGWNNGNLNGVSTNGSNVDLQFVTSGYTAKNWNMFALTTGVLEYNDGMVVVKH